MPSLLDLAVPVDDMPSGSLLDSAIPLDDDTASALQSHLSNVSDVLKHEKSEEEKQAKRAGRPWLTRKAEQAGFGVMQSGLDFLGSAGRLVGLASTPVSSTISGAGHGTADAMNRMASAIESDPTAQDDLSQIARGVTRSLGRAVPAASMGGLPAVIGEAAFTRGSQAATEAQDAGMQGGVVPYAIGQGAIEGTLTAAGSLVGKIPVVEQAVKRVPALKWLIGGGVEEVLTNQLKTRAPREAIRATLQSITQEFPEEFGIAFGDLALQKFASVDPSGWNAGQAVEIIKDTLLQVATTGGVVNAPQVGLAAGKYAADPNAERDAAIQQEVLNRGNSIEREYVDDQTNARAMDDVRTANLVGEQESQERVRQATERQQRQAGDAQFLNRFVLQRADEAAYPSEPPSVGGIRQLPISPDIELESRNPPTPQSEAPQPAMLGLPNPISEIYDPNQAAAPDRRAELQSLTVPQLNELAVGMGLKKSLGKKKLVESILAAEQPVAPAAVEEPSPVETAPEPQPAAPVNRDENIKELASLESWLEDADVSDPQYDAKSIRAQLLSSKLKKGIDSLATPAKAEPNLPEADQPSLPEPLPPTGKAPALTIPNNPLRITGATGLPGSNLLGGVGRALRKWMTSAGDLPTEAYDLAAKKDSSIATQAKQLHFELNALKDAVAEDGGTKLSPVGQDLINKALHGDTATLSQLPAKVRDGVTAIRNHIDTLSRRLIDNGLAQGKLEVTIEENMGSYVTRSYQVFDDPKWKGKVSKEVRNKAHALLKQESPNKSDHEINNMIDDMLTKEGASTMIAGRRLGSKDLSITRKRSDIAPEIRALLGEYKDPYVNAARAITKMAHLASNHEFLTSVREAGMGKFFFEKDDPNRPTGNNVQFAAEASEVMSPLNGLMTTPEIKEAFEAAYGPKGAGGDLNDAAFRVWMKAVVATKFSKTVLSPQALIRNFTGNPMFAIQNGHWRIGEVGKAVKTAGESVRSGMPQFVRKLMSSDTKAKERFLRYTELGLTHGDVYAGDLKSAVKEAVSDVPAEVESNVFYQFAKQGLSASTEAYQAADTVWKIYAFENEVKRYKAAYKAAGVNKSDPEIEQEAADIVRNTYPTYDKIPAAIRLIRRSPVVGAFVSFPAEVIRTTFHSLKQTAKELNDPVLKGIGAQRLAGNLAALAIPSALAASLRMLAGISLEDDEDMREFLPPWSKNSDIAWLYKGEDGKPGWIDMSYTLPSSVWRRPLNAMMRGEDWYSSFKDAASEFLTPYFGEELLAERMIDVARNTKANGGQVYNPASSDSERLLDSTTHILKSMEPGFMTSAGRISKAAKGTVEPSGRAYDLTQELTALGTGLRIQETDIPTSLGFAASDYANELGNATKIFTSKYASRGTVEEGEVSKAYQEADESRRKLFDQMSRKARAAINLGVSEKEVARVMRASGISLEGVGGLLAGKYTPYVPSPEIEKRAAKSSAYKTRRAELITTASR